jgi:HlyD family secretion protein
MEGTSAELRPSCDPLEDRRLDRKKTLKLAVPLAVAAIVAIVAALAWRAARGTSAGDSPAWETGTVGRGDVAAVVTASGTLSALVTVEVGSQVSGRVLALNADFNSQVKKGQIVARIDPSLFESQVAQARANEQMAVASLRGAESALAEAKRQHDRLQSLLAKEFVAEAEADTALARFQAAEAELASAKARLAQARASRVQSETNLAYTTITSPIDGVVISRDVNVGQTVASSLQAPKLFTIAEDLRKMEVHTDVAESDVGRVREGLPVQFSVDAFPGERFRGTVKEVRYAPKTVQNVVTYDAVVSVDNSDLKLRPGMTADVSFVVEDVADALLVPNAALRFRPPDAPVAQAAGSGRPARAEGAAGGRTGRGGAGAAGGQRRVVYVLAPDGTLKASPVRVGPSDGTNTAIVGGELAEGDRVVVGVAGAAKPAGAAPAAGAAGTARRRVGGFL